MKLVTLLGEYEADRLKKSKSIPSLGTIKIRGEDKESNFETKFESDVFKNQIKENFLQTSDRM
jgi:hypothetical protein